MSHFTVMVIGNDLEKQLAPFHEFECTGEDDEFVQDVDTTEESREEFNGATRKMVRLADGSVISAYDDQCYRELTEEERKAIGPMFGSGWCGPAGISYHSKDWGDGLGYRSKARYVPEGAEEFEQPFPSFAEWLKYNHHDEILIPFGQSLDLVGPNKYGYALLDEAGEVTKVVRRTNPDKRWDWWTVGGRWTGFFKLKQGAAGALGRPDLMTEKAGPGYADQACKGDVDFEAMREKAAAEAAAQYDKVQAIIAGRDWISWDAMRAANQKAMDEVREAYWAQPVLVDIRGADLGFFFEIEPYRASREQFIERARQSAASTFAVLLDGKWYERGDMGWWGMVSDEKDKDEWNSQVASLLDGLPDDTLLSVVDCHI